MNDIPTVAGERTRERRGIQNPLWNLFLDSDSTNASLFLSVQFSQNYFHSPTPWIPRQGTTLSQKVSRLLDSFRPGSSSYNPFLSKNDVNNNNELSLQTEAMQSNHTEETSNEENERLEEAPVENHPTHQTENPQNISPEEENRRRLYLNFGRPRPFYRSVSDQTDRVDTTDGEERVISRSSSNPAGTEVLSLQDLARQKLIQRYGLKKLWRLVRKDYKNIPGVISDLLLTFRCQEFQEIGVSGSRSASYMVKSVLDNSTYTAVFATTEVDKAASNIWEEEREWISINEEGVIPILGLAVDILTQNIFYILCGDYIPLKEHLNKTSESREHLTTRVGTSIKKTLKRLRSLGLMVKRLDIENIFLDSQGDVYLENDLLIKEKPYTCIKDKTYATSSDTDSSMIQEDDLDSLMVCQCEECIPNTSKRPTISSTDAETDAEKDKTTSGDHDETNNDKSGGGFFDENGRLKNTKQTDKNASNNNSEESAKNNDSKSSTPDGDIDHELTKEDLSSILTILNAILEIRT